MNIQLNTLACLIGWLLSTSVFAAQPEWKTECVGRFQVSVPGEVEVAVDRFDMPKENISTYTRFSDGSPAERSVGLHLGSISISNVVPIIIYNERVKKVEASRLGQIQNIENRSANLIKKLQFEIGNVAGWRSQAESGKFVIRLDMYAANRLVFHQASSIETASEADEAAQMFVRNFHPRPLFDLPKGEGVCIPYGFIADDGKPGRQVGVTMRLIDHPEVEIFFEDRSAADYGIKQTQQTQERTEMSMLWDQQARLSKKIDLAFPGYRSTRLAGRNGTASFVEITRKDGSPDYGYAAVVNGDHTAKTDAPQLMLYVIRTASRAKGKPVSKSELKGMAYKIAASIKRREVR